MDLIELQYNYSKWGIEDFNKSIIFIFFDEDYHPIESAPNKKQHITRIKEKPHELYEKVQQTVEFSFIYLGDRCIDIDLAIPTYIWEIEILIEKNRDKLSLVAKNKMLHEKAKSKKEKKLHTTGKNLKTLSVSQDLCQYSKFQQET